jgi:TolB-like protein
MAVLPFKYTGSSADLKALAEGLSEEVITGLSRFSYLRVIARGSTAMHSSESGDVRAVGKELGAHYVMEGTLRQSGPKLRLAVHLVDATTGAHLWAENYERTFIPESVFELQDDLVPRIVSTVAGMHGMLPQSMSEAVHGRDPEQLSPYEAVLRSFGYFERATAEELAAARKGLEFAVQIAPAYADAWAMLSLLCTQDYGQGFNLQPDSLQSGLAAARRAVEAGPSNHLAYCAQAYARFFEKDFPNFLTAAERSVEINSMDATCLAEIGVMLVHAGFDERGLALAARARQLNPNYSGRYWWGDFHNAYRQHDYRAALDIAGKIELPKHWAAICMVAAGGQLGDRGVAEKALREVLSFPSDFVTRVRNEGRKWMSPEMTDHFIEGLRKAGLQIA